MRRGRIRVLLAGLMVALAAGCGATAPNDTAAVDTLVRFYDQPSGLWPTTGWWNSANALTSLTDYMIASDDHRYEWVLRNTYDLKRSAADGDFVNELTDDTGWWALAWIRAYDLTGDARYLGTARHDVDVMWSRQDTVCGGGLWWTAARQYKNAISTELYVKAAAELADRLGDAGSAYRDHAVATWEWFEKSGMINDQLLVNDGLEADCSNNQGTPWTYNQGVLLGALVELHKITGNDDYLDRARQLADASTTSDRLHVDGVLTEPCEATGCSIDGPSFKGIYVRNLGELNRVLDDHPYSDYLTKQATTAYEKNRTSAAEYGLHWAGPIAGVSGATQQSAVDVLVAART